MTQDQVYDNIDMLVYLEKTRRLSNEQINKIHGILWGFGISRKFGTSGLYYISDLIQLNHFRKLGKVLLVQDIALKCGICGHNIIGTQNYTVDHIVPLAHDGSDLVINLQHAHDICNGIKSDSLDFLSFYNDSDVMTEYTQSIYYQMFIEERNAARRKKIDREQSGIMYQYKTIRRYLER
jgi:hypothetical protein